MSGAALVAFFLLAAPAQHVDVRVMSKHERLAAEFSGAECYKVGAGESIRGAAIGPGEVHLSLRRLAASGAKPLDVKVTRDGREVVQLSLGDKGVQAFRGERELASAPVERAIEIPSGPHTVFVEVGPGEGHALVAFDELPSATPVPAGRKPAVAAAGVSPRAPAALGSPSTAPGPSPGPRARPASAEPLAPAPAGKATPEARASPAPSKVPAASTRDPQRGPKREMDRAEADSREAAEKPAARERPTLGEVEALAEPRAGGAAAVAETAIAEVEAHLPPRAQAPDMERPSAESPATVPAVASAAMAKVPRTAEPAPTRRALGAFLGLRAGGAGQTQVGALGLAMGVSARFTPLRSLALDPAAGLLVGLSADYLRYRLALDLGSARDGTARRQGLALASIPVLAEAIWSFGAATRWRVVPSAGLVAGVSLSLASGHGSLGTLEQTEARPALGAVAGLEMPVGPNRLGAEVRYLYAATGSSGAVQNFQVGGVLFQASWRFGI
jgi:hypothetical protein